MSSWFKRKDKGIQTPTENKKDVPKGLWYKTPSGKIIDTDELKENYRKRWNIESHFRDLKYKTSKVIPCSLKSNLALNNQKSVRFNNFSIYFLMILYILVWYHNILQLS